MADKHQHYTQIDRVHGAIRLVNAMVGAGWELLDAILVKQGEEKAMSIALLGKTDGAPTREEVQQDLHQDSAKAFEHEGIPLEAIRALLEDDPEGGRDAPP